jgi:hypothetical protein
MREPKGVKGAGAVTSEEGASRCRVLHSKTRRVKLDRTRIISGKTANRKKIVDQRRSCWNLLLIARRPTRVNSSDNRVTC